MEQGWLVGEYQVGIGNGSHTGDPVVLLTMKMVDLPSAGTYVFAPQDARDIAAQFIAAADELERNTNGGTSPSQA